MKIGIDIVSIDRMKRIYKKFGFKFLHKVFTEAEIAEIEAINNHSRKIEKIAGKFAVKEAVVKASNVPVEFAKIEVLTDKTGAPTVKVENNIRYEISIAHERLYAVAVAILVENKE